MSCHPWGSGALLSSMAARKGTIEKSGGHDYAAVLADVVLLVETARSAAARSVNSVMTATYWAIGRSIVEEEQRGVGRRGQAMARSSSSTCRGTCRLGSDVDSVAPISSR